MLTLEKLNEILNTTLDKASINLKVFDWEYKKYALQSAAWDAYGTISDYSVVGIDLSIEKEVKLFLEECGKANVQMDGNPRIAEDSFPTAGKLIHMLAEWLDDTEKRNPELIQDIETEILVGAYQFSELERVIERVISN